MNMKNRFKWTDRQETEVNGKHVIADAKGKTRKEMIDNIVNKGK